MTTPRKSKRHHVAPEIVNRGTDYSAVRIEQRHDSN
jgi:hypothetical protein